MPIGPTMDEFAMPPSRRRTRLRAWRLETVRRMTSARPTTTSRTPRAAASRANHASNASATRCESIHRKPTARTCPSPRPLTCVGAARYRHPEYKNDDDDAGPRPPRPTAQTSATPRGRRRRRRRARRAPGAAPARSSGTRRAPRRTRLPPSRIAAPRVPPRSSARRRAASTRQRSSCLSTTATTTRSAARKSRRRRRRRRSPPAPPGARTRRRPVARSAVDSGPARIARPARPRVGGTPLRDDAGLAADAARVGGPAAAAAAAGRAGRRAADASPREPRRAQAAAGPQHVRLRRHVGQRGVGRQQAGDSVGVFFRGRFLAAATPRQALRAPRVDEEGAHAEHRKRHRAQSQEADSCAGRRPGVSHCA